MTKKEILIPFLVAGLTLLFAGICVAVFLSNGKSKKWVARKMKIGGLLLSLTSITCSNVPPETSCYIIDYSRTPSNLVEIKTNQRNTLIINRANDSIVECEITQKKSKNFSYAIYNYANKIVQKSNIVPFNENKEDKIAKFKLKINSKLPSGKYYIEFFAVDTSLQSANYPKNHTSLLLTNNKAVKFIKTSDDFIECKMQKSSFKNFSYAILNENGIICQKNNVLVGKLSKKPIFKIKLNKLFPGIYILNFHQSKATQQNKKNIAGEFKLIVKHK